MLALLLLATAVATPVAHTVAIADGSAITASYTASTALKTRQVGMNAGARTGSMRCDWTAAVSVDRSLVDAKGAVTATRRLAPVKTLAGSRPGDCMTNRRAIDRDIAARTGDIDAHVIAVAQGDQRELRAEIDATTAPSGR